MLRSDFIMKLMSVVLFVAVAAYLGLYIYHSAKNPLKTELAVRYTVEESARADGYVVRNETVLPGENGIAAMMAGEGEKLGAGQAVAVYYEGTTALERASDIVELQMQIKDARAALAASATLTDADTQDMILELSAAVQHRQFDRLGDLTNTVKNAVFKNSADHLKQADLEAMELRLDGLLGEASSTRTIYAPMSGVFTTAVDGYETVTPDNLESLTPSSLRALFSAGHPGSDTAAGKLITGTKWYYAAVLNREDAAALEGQRTVTLQFTNTYFDELEMTIESIGPDTNAQCVVVFSARRSLAETASYRTLTADVEFASYTGLFIPKQAVHTGRHNQTYIYLLTGRQAELVYVDILYEVPGGYVVRSGAETGTVLREGSNIIVAAENIYNGKVVAQ